MNWRMALIVLGLVLFSVAGLQLEAIPNRDQRDRQRPREGASDREWDEYMTANMADLEQLRKVLAKSLLDEKLSDAARYECALGSAEQRLVEFIPYFIERIDWQCRLSDQGKRVVFPAKEALMEFGEISVPQVMNACVTENDEKRALLLFSVVLDAKCEQFAGWYLRGWHDMAKTDEERKRVEKWQKRLQDKKV